MATRWGICSTGLISKDFCSALKSLPSSEHEVVAVAGRQKASADAFAQKFSIPTAYGSYEDLAKDPNVEIVYVGTIHPQHFPVCMLMLDHGKHVLCEKPLCMTLKQTRQLVAKARQKKLFLMEAFWTRFFPAVKKVQEVVKQGTLGRINFLQARFCQPVMHVERMVQKELGGGVLLDMGCYTVQFANLIFGRKPEKIVATGVLTETGVDKTGTLTLQYKGGATAVLLYSADNAAGSNTLDLYGSKANLQVPDHFHCPTQVQLPSGQVEEFPLPDSPYTYNFPNSNGLMYEAQCVRDCLKKGLTECPLMTLDDSVDIMEVMEESLQQMGVQYEPIA